jgi:NADH:ubiquinone oxidoreductase subunit F (NADH-binding)
MEYDESMSKLPLTMEYDEMHARSLWEHNPQISLFERHECIVNTAHNHKPNCHKASCHKADKAPTCYSP